MKVVSDFIITVSLLFGGVTLTKSAYEKVQELTTTQIKKGLSSSEKFANGLTGKKLDY